MANRSRHYSNTMWIDGYLEEHPRSWVHNPTSSEPTFCYLPPISHPNVLVRVCTMYRLPFPRLITVKFMLFDRKGEWRKAAT